MPSASTRRALGSRASQAATLMEVWAKTVFATLEKQNIDPLSDQGPSTIAFRRNETVAVAQKMLELVKEIRRFGG